MAIDPWAHGEYLPLGEVAAAISGYWAVADYGAYMRQDLAYLPGTLGDTGHG